MLAAATFPLSRKHLRLTFAWLLLSASLIWATKETGTSWFRRRSLNEYAENIPRRSGDDEIIQVSVTLSEAQTYLVIASAVLAMVKGMICVATYSYCHVVFAVAVLICTGLACAIYVLTDFQADVERANIENREEGPVLDGVTRYIFLLAYIQACATEWLDVLTTYQTARSLKRTSRPNVEIDTAQVKARANSVYLKNLFLSLLLGSAIPIILYWKADWKTSYVFPQNFSERNAKYLLITNACLAATMIPTLFCTILNATNKESMLPVTFLCFTLGSIAFPLYFVLFVIVLVDAENQEAGSLLFLLMINFVQNLEWSAEIKRLTEWWKAENGKEAKNDIEFSMLMVKWFFANSPDDADHEDD